MKKLLFSLFAGLLFSAAASAQTKAQLTAKISTPSVQCEMCKAKIEQYLKRIDGVVFINVNYKKKETTVKYLTDRTNIEMIKASIANAGYDVAIEDNDPAKPNEIEINANPESYKALPKCCKKPEDGGGMKKN
jgi:periplasmic mercuric ion binding protein